MAHPYEYVVSYINESGEVFVYDRPAEWKGVTYAVSSLRGQPDVKTVSVEVNIKVKV